MVNIPLQEDSSMGAGGAGLEGDGLEEGAGGVVAGAGEGGGRAGEGGVSQVAGSN